MSDLLKILLTEFAEKYKEAIASMVPRLAHFPEIPNKVKVAIGMRRAGKTYFLFQTIRKLIENETIPWQRFLFLNFEDDRLFPCSQDQLVELLESFYKLYPENHNEKCYLFLDEIQNVEEWPRVIRRFLDTKNVQIYLSGSSAKLLSKEIATSLRGRSVATEIWPYSFSEYLLANKIHIEKGLLGQKKQDFLAKYLQDYILHGGFPEAMNLQPADRRQLLQDYTELVSMRDIVERHKITNISLLKYLIKTLLKNVAGSFSVNKFANDIKSQGLSGARNTIYDYLSHLEDAYLAFPVALFSESIRKEYSNPRKIYAVDTALSQAFAFSFNHNFGHLFENLVFLDFKRRGHEIYYYLTQDRYEVDFLTIDRLGKQKLYQVVWDSSDEVTMERELRALHAAEVELKIPGALITPESYLEQQDKFFENSDNSR